MKRSFRFYIVFCLLSLVLLTGVFASGANENSSAPPNGDYSGVMFEAVDIHGNKIVSQELFESAKLTMVNVWATYCNPCLNEMPGLGELYRTKKDSGFEIIGVISDAPEGLDEKNLGVLRDFQNLVQVEFPFVLLNQSLMNALVSEVSVVPTTFFINNKGEIVKTVLGSKDFNSWSAIVDEILKTL